MCQANSFPAMRKYAKKKKKKIIFQNTQLRAGQKRGQNMKTVGFRMVKAYVRVYAKKKSTI